MGIRFRSVQLASDGVHDFVFTYKGKPIKGQGGVKRSFK